MTIINEAALQTLDLLHHQAAALNALGGAPAAAASLGDLSPAAWDVGTFLSNATKVIQRWGGLLIMLIGTAMLIWAAVKVGQKLMAGPQSQGQQTGWGGILLLVIVGGGLAGGGWSLMNTLGSGGKKSILDLGNGAITPESIEMVTRLLGVG